MVARSTGLYPEAPQGKGGRLHAAGRSHSALAGRRRRRPRRQGFDLRQRLQRHRRGNRRRRAPVPRRRLLHLHPRSLDAARCRRRRPGRTCKSLHYGYGVRCAFRGHDSHGLIVGPDGRIHFSIGDRGFHITTSDGRTLANPETAPRSAASRTARSWKSFIQACETRRNWRSTTSATCSPATTTRTAATKCADLPGGRRRKRLAHGLPVPERPRAVQPRKALASVPCRAAGVHRAADREPGELPVGPGVLSGHGPAGTFPRSILSVRLPRRRRRQRRPHVSREAQARSSRRPTPKRRSGKSWRPTSTSAPTDSFTSATGSTAGTGWEKAASTGSRRLIRPARRSSWKQNSCWQPTLPDASRPNSSRCSDTPIAGCDRSAVRTSRPKSVEGTDGRRSRDDVAAVGSTARRLGPGAARSLRGRRVD